jgi:hypothetical protein
MRWFSSPRAPPKKDDTALPVPGCPIRVSPGLRMCAPRRSFSQLTAPFFAVLRQGIHRLPLLYFQYMLFSYRSLPASRWFHINALRFFNYFRLFRFFDLFSLYSSYVNEQFLILSIKARENDIYIM